MADLTITGVKQLRARLRAVRQSFKPVARDWATRTVDEMRPQIPERTGKTRRSLRVGSVTTHKATVKGSYVIVFLSSGQKAHPEKPKKKSVMTWGQGGTTIFAKRVNHPQVRGGRFRERAATEAFDKVDVLGSVVRSWNEAA